MDCALWLNRRKIFSADEISANFDIAAIRGYFLGGSLAVWLSSHGGEEYSRAVSQLDPNDPCLNDRLTEIFTGKGCDVPPHKVDEMLIRAVDEFRGIPFAPVSCSFGTGSFNGEYGSFGALGSYMYGYGSFAGGSFGYGSRSWAWDWEWEWRFGSFRKAQSSFNLGSFGYGSFNYGSFSRGSFRLWEWEWEWRFGSFRRAQSSFNFGSFGALGSYLYGYGSFNYGSFGGSFRFSFGLFGGESGSFRGTAGSFVMLTPDEYDEIMYRTLGMCPLNRFGYGIHLI